MGKKDRKEKKELEKRCPDCGGKLSLYLERSNFVYKCEKCKEVFGEGLVL